MATELCTACSTITLSMLATGFKHPLDYHQALESKDDCQLCALLINAYDNQICANHSRDYILDSKLFQNGVFTQTDVQAANSPRNLCLLRDWLRECRLNHEACRRGSHSGETFDDYHGTTALPFRVIDVGPSDGSEQPRLLTTHYRAVGRYLTLSHCWGRIPPLKTTKKTVEEWHEALLWDQLPKSFQDAIWLTRELGERFLWIDSLCIVQDDPDDLGSQIQRMGAIFETSYCTIAATDAKGSDGSSMIDQGLFVRGPSNIKEAHLRLRYGLPTNDPSPNESENVQKARSWLIEEKATLSDGVYDVFIQEYHHRVPLNRDVMKKAWSMRGWVFQEQELSRRCIYFTQESLLWRCNQYWESEQTGTPERRESNTNFDFDTLGTTGGYTYDVNFNLLRFWQSSMERYSKTKLTYVSDKHNALKGMEERLGTRFNTTFRFGIFNFKAKDAQDVLLQQLLWARAASYCGSLRGDPNFCCPSWSWMIIDGPVVWTDNALVTQPEVCSKAHFGKQLADGLQELHISGLGKNIRIGTPIGKEPQSYSGWYELASDLGISVLSDISDEAIGWVVLDTPDAFSELMAIPQLQYFRMDDEEEPVCVDFLAVVEMLEQHRRDEQERYYRIGRGRVNKDAFTWLEKCERRNYIIV
ncbi:HET-domain-containing protein [Hypoxylon sp. FL1857]|nr:HET-domain-containing protein [Hypoxylon sp. FL1857]